MPGVQLAEVNALANELKKNEKIFVSVQGPEKSNFAMPNKDKLLASIQTAANRPLKAYEEKALAASLLEKTPAAGQLVGETKNDGLGITELTYSNGTRVIIKNTNFKQDEIILTGFKKGGIKDYIEDGFIVRCNFCSVDKEGVSCAEFIEKDIGAKVRGRKLKKEIPSGNCIICNKEAKEVVYIARDY